jgi:hypothetical protein
MSLSKEAAKALATGIAHRVQDGQEVVNAINSSSQFVGMIVATNVSATHDFSSLQVNDLLVHIPATAGNASFEKCVTAGTKPSAAVVGDLYIQLRPLLPQAPIQF